METELRTVELHLTRTDMKRFFSHIEMPEGWSGHWLWGGSKDRSGYGRFYIRGKWVGAHIVSARLFKSEEYQPSLDVGHDCPTARVRNCVSPFHLKMQTRGDNLKDRQYGTPKSGAERVKQLRQRKRERAALLAPLREKIKELGANPTELFQAWQLHCALERQGRRKRKHVEPEV